MEDKIIISKIQHRYETHTHKILPLELCRGKQRQHRFWATQSQPCFRCLVLRTELRMLHTLGKCSPVSDAIRLFIFNSPERKYPHYTAQRFVVEILVNCTVCVLYEQIAQKPHTGTTLGTEFIAGEVKSQSRSSADF